VNIQFIKTDSKQYTYAWIFMIILGWILWFFALDHIVRAGGFLFAVIVGFFTGILSGLPPVKAFKVCFYGFCVIALILLFGFPTVALSQVLVGALSGLFAIAGAILRRITLHQVIEIHLRPWQWILLIGGVTLFADFFIILSIVQELFTYHHFNFLYQYLIPVLAGLFAAGLFVGAFSHSKHENLMKSLRRLLFGCHGVFVVFVILVFIIEGKIEWDFALVLPFTVLFSILVLGGIQIGVSSRNSKYIRYSGENYSN
jgi:hypothetical protein